MDVRVAANPLALSHPVVLHDKARRLQRLPGGGQRNQQTGDRRKCPALPTNDSLHEDLDDRLILARFAVAIVVLVLLLSA